MVKTSRIFSTLRTLTRIELSVLQGIISGDGDIGGRMASSHPDAVPPVSEERRQFLTNLANDCIKADVSFEQINSLWGKNNEANPN
jgi:hypothetical protein